MADSKVILYAIFSRMAVGMNNYEYHVEVYLVT